MWVLFGMSEALPV